ncbi:MAG: hypothetical protein HC797_03950 [Anaerolineales bacterium]|nr:hypothetical protein [Anaerolineales bacterium]
MASRDAAAKAAELAKVANYEVTDLATLAGVNTFGGLFFIQSPDGVTLPYPNEAGTYLLYIPPLPVR